MKAFYPGTFVLLASALQLLAVRVDAQEPPEPVPQPAEEVAEPPYSPRGAFFRSLVLPGWGQAYVGAPGRGAVFFGMATGSFWMTYVARRQLLDAQREQEWLIESGQLGEGEENEFTLARGRHVEDWIALSLFLMFLSGADAYVSAYLADFEERIGVFPESASAIRLEARIPIGGGE